MQRPLPWVLALAGLLPVGTIPTLAADDRPPNIVHILADDVGYDDLGCFGARDIPTPNLDRMATEGKAFTSFYAPHSTCTASRAAILTGCYAPRVGLSSVLFPDARVGLNPAEITIAELLKSRGYATACIGKWHLGHLPEFLPTRHGFDSFFGIPYPNDHVPERLTANEPRRTRGFPPMPLIRGESVVEQPAQLASLPERFTAEAEQFIADHKDRPFFVHFSNIETHTPWLVARPHQYRSRAGVYGDAVVSLDATVGRILDAVKAHGLDERTLIVFSSDNGPLVHAYPELEGIYGHAATVDVDRKHLLREGKYQSRYEGGTRVACLMRWPGSIRSGTRTDGIAAGFDLYTTFATLAGAEIPADRVIDGKDISPLMFSHPGTASPHDSFLYYEANRLVAVRTGRWKLVLPAKAQDASPQLFDLDADLGETTDLAAANPAVVRRLESLAESARQDIGDARTGRTGRNARPAGRAE